jgi:hypothetical protein
MMEGSKDDDRLTVTSADWKIIAQATHESVDHLATFTGDGGIKLAAKTLRAIRFLLKFHPNKNVRQASIELIQQLLTGERNSSTHEQIRLQRMDQNIMESLRQSKDPMDKVLAVILEYGRQAMEEEKKEGQKRDFNNT